MTTPVQHATGDRRGFTLIELLAVLVIIGLFMTLVLPNLDVTRNAQLREEALNLAGRLELARQRAVVTGAPHRVWLDLEAGAYSVEWFVDETRAYPEESDQALDEESDGDGTPSAGALATGGKGPISLSPPQGEQRDYHPIPGRFGRESRLPTDHYFVGIETPEGWLESGQAQVVFAVDGTSDFSEIILADAWDNKITLEIQPLLDQVRIHSDSAR